MSIQLPLTTPARFPQGISAQACSQRTDPDYEEEEDILSAARARMEAREFKRVSTILKGCQSTKARFLNIYSQFIVSGFSAYQLVVAGHDDFRCQKKLLRESGIS